MHIRTVLAVERLYGELLHACELKSVALLDQLCSLLCSEGRVANPAMKVVDMGFGYLLQTVVVLVVLRSFGAVCERVVFTELSLVTGLAGREDLGKDFDPRIEGRKLLHLKGGSGDKLSKRLWIGDVPSPQKGAQRITKGSGV